mgnify:CR=1 FL=1
MQIQIIDGAAPLSPETALAVLAFDGGALSDAAKALDGASGGALARAVTSGRFTGAKGQTLELLAPPSIEAGRVLLIGAGPQAELNAQGIETAAAQAYQACVMRVGATNAAGVQGCIAQLQAASMGGGAPASADR